MKYYPLNYIKFYKRPKRKYFLKQVLWGDFPIIYLVCSHGNLSYSFDIIGILLLIYSFWIIYEIGYVENDFLGLKNEDNPNLSNNFLSDYEHIGTYYFGVFPWLLSSAFAILGIIFVSINRFSLTLISFYFLKYLLGWLIFLVILRFTFFFYNRLDTLTRVWIFPILQAEKTFGFLLFYNISQIGLLLFFSHMVSRWIPYILYRYGCDHPENVRRFPVDFLRFIVFLSLALIKICTSENFIHQNIFEVAILLCFCFFQSIKDIYQIFHLSKFYIN